MRIDFGVEFNSKCIDGNDIELYFGERLTKMGFVPHMHGNEWYALKNGTIFFSVLFECEPDKYNIYMRIQPLCTHIIFPIERYKNAKYDQQFCSINALGYCLLNNITDDIFDSVPEKLNVLFNSVVVHFYEKVNDFKDALDILLTGDVCDKVAFAYLSGDTDAFYNNEFVKNAYPKTAMPSMDIIPFLNAKREFSEAICVAIEENDIALFGQYLKKCEEANVVQLKRRLPALFKCKETFTLLTDDYIVSKAVSEVRVPFVSDIQMAFDDIELVYEAMPYESANMSINLEECIKSTKKVIREYFFEELSSRGFLPLDDGMEWHKLINDCLYQRIYFSVHPNLQSVHINYESKTLGEEIILYSKAVGFKACEWPEKAFFELLGMSFKQECFSNPFDSGQRVFSWQVRRLKMLLRYVVYPYMEATKTLEGMCKNSKYDISAACLLKKYDDIDDKVMQQHRWSAESWLRHHNNTLPIKASFNLSKVGHHWTRTREKVFAIGFLYNDMDYIRDYYLKCIEFNLRYLRTEIPELFM